MYRGQQSTQQKIAAISQLRITTKAEAIAFLRAISTIELQIADILQRQEIRAVGAANQTIKPIEQAKEVQTTPVVEEPEEPMFEDKEEHTETEKESRVARLKKATKR